MDLLDNIDIVCKTCKSPMEKGIATKEGFRLRAYRCPKCKSQYLHPSDLDKYKQYHDLKEKPFNMKLRMIGNSFCISIPREIIRFNHVEENSIVSLSMTDPEHIKLTFHKTSIVRD